MERENGSCSQLRPSIFFRVQSLKCVITRGCRRGVSPCQGAGLRLCCCLCQSVQAQPALPLASSCHPDQSLLEQDCSFQSALSPAAGRASLAVGVGRGVGDTSESLREPPLSLGSFFPPALPASSAQVKANLGQNHQGDLGGRATPGYLRPWCHLSGSTGISPLQWEQELRRDTTVTLGTAGCP